MMKFAKVFEFPDVGQVLVKLEDADLGPEVRVYFMVRALGVCSVVFLFHRYGEAELTFDKIDETTALGFVRGAIETIPVGTIQ